MNKNNKDKIRNLNIVLGIMCMLLVLSIVLVAVFKPFNIPFYNTNTTHSVSVNGNTVVHSETKETEDNPEITNVNYKISRLENPGIAINELVVENKSYLLDEDGDCVDWIEVFNRTDDNMQLSNFYLSDMAEDIDSLEDKSKLLKWQLPEVELSPGSYYVIYLSEKGKDNPAKANHTNFRLSLQGESLILSLKVEDKIEICAQIQTEGLEKNTVYVPVASDEEHWEVAQMPTPGAENSVDGYMTLQNEQLKSFGQTIFISEVMSSNSTVKKDKDGDYSDWIEIKNNSDIQILLEGMSLSDNLKNKSKWTFPDVKVEPQSSLLVFASGKDLKNPETELHTNFSLSKSSENLVLSGKNGEVLDYMMIPTLDSDMSFGRSADNSECLFFKIPTPGTANGEGFKEKLEKPVFSQKGGTYSSRLTIELSSLNNGADIYYTTDCTIPTVNSLKYNGAISIDRTTVVRAMAFKGGAIASKVETNTYLLGVNHDLEIVSLVLEPDDLFDEDKGIYATGKGASTVFPHKGANYWKDWEKAGHIEFYNDKNEQGFSLNVGVKIFGAYSRAADQKSFSIISRSKYDNQNIKYPLFEDKPELTEFKSLVLRTSGQDYNLTKIRDALMGQLFADTNVDYQSYRPSVMYLNGEYWGIYNIREKISEHFLAANHGIEDPSKIDIIESNTRVKQGSNKEYLDLIKFVTDNDMKKQENYEYVKTKIDIANYIDYQIAEIYCANTDLVNIRFWKPQTEDGKWRWILYDTDWGMFSKDVDSFAMAISPNGNGVSKANNNVIMRKLIWNAEFQAQFLERLKYLLENNLSTKNVLAKIELMSGRIRSEIPNEIVKWKHWSKFERWDGTQLDRLRNWAKEEPQRLVKFVIKDLKLTGDIAVSLKETAEKASKID